MNNTRRNFLKAAGAVGAVSTFPLIGCQPSAPKRVVVVGGGFGGATAAKYLKFFDPAIDVTLITPEDHFYSCPLSNVTFFNAKFAGFTSLDSLKQNYKALAEKHKVNVVIDLVVGVEPGKGSMGEGGKVTTKGGRVFEYDRLIMSPGIDMKDMPGYTAAEHDIAPHAWKAGPQTALLNKQLQDLENGKPVIIVAPADPYRCPPGPYERAGTMAYYLKNNKPKSKVIILDAKEDFAKKGLFMEGWEQNMKGYVEWVPASKDGKVTRVDAAKRIAYTEFGEHKAGVLNVIPPQSAGKIAIAAGLTNDKGWCDIDLATFESKKAKGIHVIGDAAVVTGMPKSGNAANTQAKVAAAAVSRFLNGEKPGTPKTTNTCYSMVTPEWGISVTAVYELGEKGYAGVKGSGGVSPAKAGDEFRRLEAKNAWGWYINIAQDIWG
ncbi:MAG: FCSD flavin-binding domain-containing protein [Magnetospirillum sp. WYHS-4]